MNSIRGRIFQQYLFSVELSLDRVGFSTYDDEEFARLDDVFTRLGTRIRGLI